jgi:hypothetical protein
VPLRDRLNNIENLTDLSNLKFDTKDKEAATPVQSNVNIATDVDNPMWALCEIDTTLAGYVVDTEYALYVKYTNGSEAPILGPVFFRVVSD